MCCVVVCLFFFSSRRRHTRSKRDWSSDVCSSDLSVAFVVNSGDVDATLAKAATVVKATYLHPYQMHGSMGASCAVADRSEERRVGKECRSRWLPAPEKKRMRSMVGAGASRRMSRR